MVSFPAVCRFGLGWPVAGIITYCNKEPDYVEAGGLCMTKSQAQEYADTKWMLQYGEGDE